LLVIGCKDGFLNTPPKDKIAINNFFKSEADLRIYTNGFYDMLSAESLYFQDSKSDNIVPFVVSRRVRGTRQVPTARGSGWWSWSNLREINYFLKNYQRVEDEEAKQYYAGIDRKSVV